MKLPVEIFESAVTAEAVDVFSDKIRNFCALLKIPKRDIVRYTMTSEEILLDAYEDGEFEKIALTTGKRFFRPYFSVTVVGKQRNVFSKKDENGNILANSILKNLGLSPEYNYSSGKNTYLFRPRKKSFNPILTLVLAITGAIAVGLLGFLFSDAVRTGLLDSFLTPLYDTFINILSCVAGPMVFLAVAWGIYGIGDAATLKRIGKRLLSSYIGTVFVCTLFFSVACLPFFKLAFSKTAGNMSEFSSVFSMLLGIIPGNLFTPFTDGNTLQIIFLAVVIGIAMLFLGKKTVAVARAVEQINYIVQFFIEFISRLVPGFIFIVILRLIWSDSVSKILGVGKYIIVSIICILVMLFAVCTVTSLRLRVSPLTLIKKGLPTFLVAITTASSAAAFGVNMNACKKEYGIDETIMSFGIPLGMVTFKPTTAIVYLVSALYFAEVYSIEISATWIFMLFFSAGILAVATPPIPGGAMTAYTVLFTQLGIPAEALAIVLACDALFDFICTGFDQFLIPFGILPQASRLGLVNKEILKSK